MFTSAEEIRGAEALAPISEAAKWINRAKYAMRRRQVYYRSKTRHIDPEKRTSLLRLRVPRRMCGTRRRRCPASYMIFSIDGRASYDS